MKSCSFERSLASEIYADKQQNTEFLKENFFGFIKTQLA